MAEKFSETVSFDVSKKHAPTVLGDVLVLGLGKSGKAASTYFTKQLGSRVASLTVYAGASSTQAQDFAKSLTSQGAVVLSIPKRLRGRMTYAWQVQVFQRIPHSINQLPAALRN